MSREKRKLILTGLKAEAVTELTENVIICIACEVSTISLWKQNNNAWKWSTWINPSIIGFTYFLDRMKWNELICPEKKWFVKHNKSSFSGFFFQFHTILQGPQKVKHKNRHDIDLYEAIVQSFIGLQRNSGEVFQKLIF